MSLKSHSYQNKAIILKVSTTAWTPLGHSWFEHDVACGQDLWVLLSGPGSETRPLFHYILLYDLFTWKSGMKINTRANCICLIWLSKFTFYNKLEMFTGQRLISSFIICHGGIIKVLLLLHFLTTVSFQYIIQEVQHYYSIIF